MRAQEGPSGFQQNVFFACQLFHVCSAFIIDLHQYLCQGKWLRLHHHLQQHLLSSLYTFGLYARIETGQRNAIFPSQRSSQDLIYFSFNGGGWLWNIETISGDVFIVTPLISLIFMQICTAMKTCNSTAGVINWQNSKVFQRLNGVLEKYCSRADKHSRNKLPVLLRFLNKNYHGFCSKSVIAGYPIMCIYVNYFAEGSSSDQ